MSLECSTLHPKKSIFLRPCLLFISRIMSSMRRFLAGMLPIHLIVSSPNSPNCFTCSMSRAVRRIPPDGSTRWYTSHSIFLLISRWYSRFCLSGAAASSAPPLALGDLPLIRR